VGIGNINSTRIVALPAFLLLAGCFGVPAATDPPAVAPANAVTVRACTESGADWRGPKGSDPKTRDAVCVKELGKLASRKGKVLTLKLDNGEAKTFRSRDESYYLTGFYPAYATAGAYLVAALAPAAQEFTLIDVHTGETKTFNGVPYLAPDHQTYFILECDGSCSLSIKSMTSSTPLWEGEKNGVSSDTWDFARWIDNDQVVLRTERKSELCPQGGKCEAILKRSGDSWKLESLPPRS
jgi:hypothetical protein